MAITAASTYFTVSGSDTIDLSVSSETDPIILGDSTWWTIQALDIAGLSDETVTYTIQTTLDASSDWADYEPAYYSAVPLITQSTDDARIRSVYLRLKIDVNTNTSGTCKIGYWTKP